MRVYQLAKDLGITSRQLIAKLKELGIETKGHMSSLDENSLKLAEEAFAKPGVKVSKEEIVKKPHLKEIEVDFPITLKLLSTKMSVKPSIVIKRMIEDRGEFFTINQNLEQEAASSIAGKFGYQLKRAPTPEELLFEIHKKETVDLKPRSPVVTLMGHVDHGKTSLLDAIKASNIIETEHGGITQHIGAYEVNLPKGKITFLDTPGHEAFTAMRARGANVTDIVVLVIAADDGVMPQTIEAIDHARAAGVPIIAAINKCDLAQADIQKVKRQLSDLDLTPEEWGGKTITVEVSAKTNMGIEKLLEMILLEAEMLELKADFNKSANGIIIESRLTRGKGSLVTLLVQNGLLRLGDIVIAGNYFGRIKAMFDYQRKAIDEAGPSRPVEVLGFSGVPEAGEMFYVADDERMAKEITLKRQELQRQRSLQPPQRISLEDLHARIKEGRLKELKIILKADVQGSLEALIDALGKLATDEVSLKVMHRGIGVINRSDCILAMVTESIIIGFHVQPDDKAQELIKAEGIDVRTYRVIYEVINDLKAALEGLLEPKIKRIFLGRAQVRRVFRVSKAGIIAGCYVLKGKVKRGAEVSLIREGAVILKSKVFSLKHLKDDVREISEGMECGIGLGKDADIKQGDTIEAYEIEKVARKL